MPTRTHVTLLLAMLCLAPLTGVAQEPAAETKAAVVSPAPRENRPTWTADKEDRDKVNEAWRRITEWYAEGSKPNTRKLFVTYFMPNDRKPHPEHRARLDRILRHVRDFYAREMEANGLPPLTFAIETEADGLLKLHECVGDKPLSGYDKHANAGHESRLASAAALQKAGVDLAKNHVLIVCQMPDGISPYYGGGSQKDGICWICDLPGLDSDNLASRLDAKETAALATNDEELKNFRGRALGAHTSVYVGGTAHELGHCFQLPHTGQSREQSAALGTSLMGFGNYSYGEELRGQGKGSFLNPTDALRLVSHPLFTGRDKQVEQPGKAVFADLRARPEGNATRITGRIAKANIPAYAVVVNFNPGEAGGDYYSNSASSLVDEQTGEFSLLIRREHTGPVNLLLTALHLNGARTEMTTPTSSRGVSLDTGRLNLDWAFAEPRRLHDAGDSIGALAAARELRNAESPVITARAARWIAALTPAAPVGPAPLHVDKSVTTVSLADCAAAKESTGYGPTPPARNRLPMPGYGPLPTLEAKTLDKSLFTHAPGSFTFDLGRDWKKLTGIYGVQRGAHGAVALKVYGDGKLLFDGPVTKNKAVPFDLSVDGVKTLELRVTDGGDGNGGDWALIGEPTLTR